MIRPMRNIITIISAVAAGLLITGVWMLLHEDRYIYFPDREMVTTPDRMGLRYQDLRLKSRDGVLLQAWWIPASQPVGTLLHLHGNAGNISHRISLYREWQRLGLNVLAIEYRGYGNSEGKPSEKGLYLDADTAWRYLTETRHLSPSRIIIAGRSLGAAVACHLAKERHPAGVALETPFSSVADMARYHYPWLPVWPFTRNRFDTAAMIRDVRAPVLVVGAVSDTIAPPTMAETVFNNARQPKRAIRLKGGHNNFDEVSRPQWRNVWRQWLASLPGLSKRPVD